MCKHLRKIPKLVGAIRLETLNCNGCESLDQLPCMTHLVSLKWLNLSDCRLIAEFPEVKGLKQLVCLRLGGTKIEEVPSFVGSLEKLRRLEMRETNISEINLEVPRRQCLEKLDVSDCKELERVTFAEYPGNVDENLEEFLLFMNCNKLNKDARDNITAHVMRIIRYLAKQSAKQLAEKSIDVIHESNPHRVQCCFPGSKISAKFEYCRNDLQLHWAPSKSRPFKLKGKWMGVYWNFSNFSVNLKSGCATDSTRFLYFALFLVLHSESHYVPHTLWFECNYQLKGESHYVPDTLWFECNYQLKGTDGSSQNFKRHWSLKPPARSSGEHVYVVFREDMVHRDKDYKEASFSLFFESSFGCAWKDISVNKIGIQVLSVDAESLTVTPVCCTLTFLPHQLALRLLRCGR
ncbi:hypothetical protein COLO4_10154 [Corchorus olitorius]|uniref:Uncharacterized protein n=1 Tax=Corchorus olitorius TaxID=93759 RepID=A0A1R3K9Y4_9ROSI|nr:hypothetical protein COLO4_10154 [Corchorus olitorius]